MAVAPVFTHALAHAVVRRHPRTEELAHLAALHRIQAGVDREPRVADGRHPRPTLGVGAVHVGGELARIEVRVVQHRGDSIVARLHRSRSVGRRLHLVLRAIPQRGLARRSASTTSSGVRLRASWARPTCRGPASGRVPIVDGPPGAVVCASASVVTATPPPTAIATTIRPDAMRVSVLFIGDPIGVGLVESQRGPRGADLRRFVATIVPSGPRRRRHRNGRKRLQFVSRRRRRNGCS